ncbi:Serine/threonine-protein kinase PknB [Enhygromyxa salina]|uniref:Serine/threonine-protein kinase PknB n=1 Tax=Enhygromyxa salina TaxID=215803 RepID=A0A2S9YLB3_9BACT|nr:serine/threonine-protein kinase [Enhygromyxa salina]PRQ05858.1 Serine/threonine-protein kinase PknB [Enhygromyxa salina]
MSDERRETLSDSTSVGLKGKPAPDARAPVTAPLVEQGAHIGRYVVLDKLGEGTMGVVFAAHDPELDRKVAIKLLKARKHDQAPARARLQREAQALAKLNHRNVVGVYDVGVHAGQLFLAMEFVEGQTLRDWVDSEPRSWRELLRVTSEAGRGLAAAHGAGLVHRDFKPDNVMIHGDGRVRVMDFGLARAEIHDQGVAPASSSPELEVLSEMQAKDGALTQTGTVMGTPGYMARELFEGQSADARSDQFAFCVTLYEALYEERPFPGRTLAELIRAVREGRISPAPRGSGVPAWLRAVILRGLSDQAYARWPSMQDLLDTLAEGPKRRRRRVWAAVGLSAALIGGVWAAAVAVEDARMCEGVDAELGAVWNDARRAELGARFERSELSYAADAWQRAERGLDDYAQRWQAARAEVCEARRRAQQSSEELRLRVACLDQRLSHLRATIDVLAAADATTVARAVEMVADLPRLERCTDVAALAIDAPPPEDAHLVARVAALEQQLAEAEALEKAGNYRDGLALTAAVTRAAITLEHDRLLARARLREGILQRRAGDFEASEAALVEAYELAGGLRMTAEAAEASASLVFVVGYRLARHEDGRRWAIHAKPLARAAGTDEAEALFLNNLGAVAYGEGDYPGAREQWEQALTIRERAFGADHPKVAGSLNNLGVLAHAEGDFERARGYHERALAIWTQALGPAHPQTSYSLNHLGRVALEQGRYEDARDYHTRALAIREQALGPEHTLVADTLASLARLAEREGELDQALAHDERALAIYERSLGSRHPSVADALTDRGLVLLARGDEAEARASLERALAIYATGASEGDASNLAKTRFALARVVAGASRRDRARARELAELARAAYAALGPKSARELAAVQAWLAQN